ncbi:hypothetical protein Dimus_014617 [Dionaea muscipula]
MELVLDNTEKLKIVEAYLHAYVASTVLKTSPFSKPGEELEYTISYAALIGGIFTLNLTTTQWRRKMKEKECKKSLALDADDFITLEKQKKELCSFTNSIASFS